MNSTQEAAAQVAVSTWKVQTECPECGHIRRTNSTIKSPVCRPCRNVIRQNAALEPGDALIGGHWVGGLVKRWVELPIPHTPARTLGVTCRCGCLLLATETSCPQCMVLALGPAALVDRVAA